MKMKTIVEVVRNRNEGDERAEIERIEEVVRNQNGGDETIERVVEVEKIVEGGKEVGDEVEGKMTTTKKMKTKDRSVAEVEEGGKDDKNEVGEVAAPVRSVSKNVRWTVRGASDKELPGRPVAHPMLTTKFRKWSSGKCADSQRRNASRICR